MPFEDPITAIDAIDLIRIRPDPGGARLTKLMDTIIGAQCHFFGVPDSVVETNLRTTQLDGGVDTRVRAQIDHDPDGWMNCPTAWQYKSTGHREVSLPELAEEVNKTFAAQCTKDGYAYRLCICDSMPPEKKQKWESELLELVRKIDPKAPVPLVLTADNVAAWVNKFPGIVVSTFRPYLVGRCLAFEKWSEQSRATTREYVAIEGWSAIQTPLLRHLDFSVEPPDVVFPLQGEAGVGKSRFVYETVSAANNARAFALYANDGHVELARILATEDRRVILIADECPLNTRMALRDLGKPLKRSLRIVTIDNSGDRPTSGTPEHWLAQASPEERERILGLNYPEVPAEHRRRYAELSRGFIRLAADMCQHHAQIVAEGHHRSIIESVRDYYHSRLNDEERQYIEAIALFDRVGFKDDKVEEFKKLCDLTAIPDHAKARERILRLHEVPGFVAIAGRFLYVTPEIVADAAFHDAYKRWLRHDGDGFLRRIPGELLDRFLKRARKSTVTEVHELVAAFFRTWALGLGVPDLGSYDAVTRLITLAENDPDTFVPIIVSLVERLTNAHLTTDVELGGRWGPVREMVWFAERLAQFPAFLGYAERILLRLAVLGTEPGISNNAEGVWKHLFRIVLSGTATPFEERLRLLEKRILDPDEGVVALALKALDELFDRSVAISKHSALISGRTPPEMWSPGTWGKWAECEREALGTLSQLLKSEQGVLRRRGIEILINNLRAFLQHGHLPEVRVMLQNTAIDDELLAELLGQFNSYLHFAAQDPSRYPPGKHVEEVRALAGSLTKQDLHGQIVRLIGVDPWQASLIDQDTQWRNDLKDVAARLLQDEALFRKEMDWLFSSRAKAAIVLGEQLGRLDDSGRFLETLIRAALTSKMPALARGYLIGALPTLEMETVNALFDEAEVRDPALAFDLFIVGGRATHAIERTLRLIDTGRLKLRYLRAFEIGIDHESLRTEEFKAVLERLKKAMPEDEEAAEIAIELLAYQMVRGGEEKTDLPHEIAGLVWDVLEMSAPSPGRATFWWGKLLEHLSQQFPARATAVAARALVKGSYMLNDTAEDILMKLARTNPEAVMEEIGRLMLDEQLSHIFFAAKFHLFASLPETIVIDWLKVQGVEAARTIARHLPAPSLDGAGAPLLPPLTEFVLGTYGDDERVFVEFVAGLHSLQTYTGDIASIHDREASIATKFLTHLIPAVQRWARIELEDSRKQAEHWRRREEEQWLS
jgi:hypothetical protein